MLPEFANVEIALSFLKLLVGASSESINLLYAYSVNVTDADLEILSFNVLTPDRV